MIEEYEKIQSRKPKSFYESIKEGLYLIGDEIYSIFNSFSGPELPKRFRGRGGIRLSVDRNNKKSIEEKLNDMRLDDLEAYSEVIRDDWEAVGNYFSKGFARTCFLK